MKKNKGFTLVELLAVLVILSILVAFSTIAVGKIKNRQEAENRRNVFSGILTAAKRYAADHPEIFDNHEWDDSSKIAQIYVQDLVDEKYYEFDEEKYPFITRTIIGRNESTICSSTNGDRDHERCRVVEIKVCNYEAFRNAGNGKLAFAFYDLRADREMANYLNNKAQVPYTDCGCEEQNSSSPGKKICTGIDNPSDPGDLIY